MADLLGNSLHYLTILEVSNLIRQKHVSPAELTQLMLERISNLDAQLHSYACLMPDHAMNAAREAEKEIMKGTYRGPLHGIPIAVKDLCYTEGVSTMGGLKVLSDFIPDYDATVIAKLNTAGAIVLGKLNLTEGAVGGYHRDFSIPVNPWGKNLWTGSSSSGSAVATAAGLCYASLGSDTGGSIRFPAMANGIVGLKPTYGRVSRYGILPLAESLDHIGPMTRTVADAAAVFEVISGSDPNDQTCLSDSVPNISANLYQGIQGLRIGYDQNYSSKNVDTILVDAIEKGLIVLEHLGAKIVSVNMPDTSGLQKTWRTICTCEAAKAHSSNYPSRAEEYGAFFGDFLKIGSEVTDRAYQTATQERLSFNSRFGSMLNEVDAFISPGGGVPCSIPPGFLYKSMQEIRSILHPYSYFQFTIPANFTGVPSLSLPCGISKLDIPYTFQIQGPHLSESLLCRIGHTYEQATDWHRLHPDI